MPIVLVSSQIASAPSASAAPSAPNITSRTASPSESIVITASAPSTAAAAESAIAAPSSASGSAFSGLRFHAVSSNPARSRFRPIAAPMIPVPRSPIVRRSPATGR
jgi:hypothetical protein